VAKMADAVEEGKAMRKDEEIEAEAAARPEAEAEAVAAFKASHAMEVEVDPQDNELLGESTLAKLVTSPRSDDVEGEEKIEEDVEPASNENNQKED
jgi:hypothetical protein